MAVGPSPVYSNYQPPKPAPKQGRVGDWSWEGPINYKRWVWHDRGMPTNAAPPGTIWSETTPGNWNGVAGDTIQHTSGADTTHRAPGGTPGGVDYDTDPAPPPGTGGPRRESGGVQPPTGGRKGSAPGWYEQWYAGNKGKYGAPTETSNYWNGQKGWFTNPQGGETSLNQAGDDITNMSSAYDSAWDQVSGQYTRPGSGESWWAGNKLNPTGAIGDFYNTYGTSIMNPGQLSRNTGQITDAIMDADALAEFFNKNRGSLENKGYTETMADNYQRGPSYTEDYLFGGGFGDDMDTVYNRMYSKGAKALDEAAAARGGYGSGAALRNLQEYRTDLDADRASKTAAAVRDAETGFLGRSADERSTMTAADNAMLGRLGLGFQGAEGVGRMGIAKGGALRDLYGAIDARDLNAFRAAADTASAASTDERGRYATNLDAAFRAQDAERTRGLDFLKGAGDKDLMFMNRKERGASLREKGQRLALDRIMGGMEGSGMADDRYENRLTLGGNAAHLAQQSQETRQRGDFLDAMSIGNAKAGVASDAYGGNLREQWEAGMSEIQGMLARGEIDAAGYEAEVRDFHKMAGIPISVAMDKYLTGIKNGTVSPSTPPPPISGQSGKGDDDLPVYA